MKNLGLRNVAKYALLGLGLAIALAAPSLDGRQPRPVMNGAMQICELIDGGTVTTLLGGGKMCCARERQYSDDVAILSGRKYCVWCPESASNNCVVWYPERRRTDTNQTWFNNLALRLQRQTQTPKK